MRKLVSIVAVLTLALSLGAQEAAVDIDAAIRGMTDGIVQELPAGAKVGVDVFRSDRAELSQYLSRGFERELIADGSLTIVEYDKENLAKVDEEVDYQQSGFVSEEEAAELGERMGVQYLVTGSFDRYGARTMRLTVRVTNIKTVQVVVADSRFIAPSVLLGELLGDEDMAAPVPQEAADVPDEGAAPETAGVPDDAAEAAMAPGAGEAPEAVAAGTPGTARESGGTSAPAASAVPEKPKKQRVGDAFGIGYAYVGNGSVAAHGAYVNLLSSSFGPFFIDYFNLLGCMGADGAAFAGGTVDMGLYVRMGPLFPFVKAGAGAYYAKYEGFLEDDTEAEAHGGFLAKAGVGCDVRLSRYVKLVAEYDMYYIMGAYDFFADSAKFGLCFGRPVKR